MHGLDESEDIRCGDDVVATKGDHKGKLGFVQSIDHGVGSDRAGPIYSHYRVTFYDRSKETYEASKTKPPTLSRISSEEAAAMVATVTDTIG